MPHDIFRAALRQAIVCFGRGKIKFVMSSDLSFINAFNILLFAGNAEDRGIVVFGEIKFDESSGSINFLKVFQQKAKYL